MTLPTSAQVLKNSSSCGEETGSEPSLAITFGRGCLLKLNFTKNTTRYSVQHMYFTYNLSDTQFFPNASTKGKTHIKHADPKGWEENLPFPEPPEEPLSVPALLSHRFLSFLSASSRCLQSLRMLSLSVGFVTGHCMLACAHGMESPLLAQSLRFTARSHDVFLFKLQ